MVPSARVSTFSHVSSGGKVLAVGKMVWRRGTDARVTCRPGRTAPVCRPQRTRGQARRAGGAACLLFGSRRQGRYCGCI